MKEGNLRHQHIKVNQSGKKQKTYAEKEIIKRGRERRTTRSSYKHNGRIGKNGGTAREPTKRRPNRIILHESQRPASAELKETGRKEQQ